MQEVLGDLGAVRIGQRIVEIPHGIGGQRPPGAADHIYRAGMRDSPADAGELIVHMPGEGILSGGAQRGQAHHATVVVGQLGDHTDLRQAGEPAQVEVMRATPSGAQRITLSVVTGELPEEAQASGAEPKRPPAEPGTARALGAEVADLTAEQRGELNIEGGGGVIVREVNEGPMAVAGVKTGDVILSINHMPVKSAKHLKGLIAELPPGKHVPLYVVREGAPSFLALKAK